MIPLRAHTLGGLTALACCVVGVVGCSDDPTPGNHPAVQVDGFGRLASICVDGFRVFIADHEQVGYGVAAVADPECEETPR